MSRENLSGGGCHQRYKGIENFLRRVAFNLGNTPSETEVKIISCIPIDVTDLQQKIADLERQLEGTAANNACFPEGHPSQDRWSSPEMRFASEQRSSNEKRSSSNKLPKKQSSGSKLPPTNKGISKPTSIVANQVACVPSNSKDDCNRSSVSVHFDYSPRQSKKSTISFLYPTSPGQNCNIVAEAHFEDNNNNSTNKREKLKYPQKSFFNKKKSRTTKKKNCQTKLVYYAATDNNTPFNNNVLGDDSTSKNAHGEGHDDFNDDEIYFSHILNKQYMPRPALNDLSNTSEFSSPVCRDNVTCRATSPYESDVCSCCRGPFENLDQHMTPAYRYHLYPSFTDKENDNKYAYYDSSAYDVIPVKEKNYKSVEDFDVLNRRNFKRHIDIKCWPESVRPKKVQPTVPTFVRGGRRKQRVIVNCHTVVPTRNNLKIKTNKIKNKKDIVLNKMAARRPIMTHSLNVTRNCQDSKICEIDFGEIYAKQTSRRQKLLPKPVIVHNASCSTTVLNNSECQTGMETNESHVEDKTTVTLNQIKSILQSVLTEVKTKGKLTSDPEPKKDAVVQNSFSQSNMCGGSHLLNSFTYSHFNTNPYIASCSRQIPSNNYCPPNAPYSSGAKCVQQYPLFVQPTRPVCTTCGKNNHVAKQMATMIPIPTPAQAVTASTNTDQTRDRSKETQKLIKEIYNSIALNIEIPTKDTGMNQGDRNKNSRTYVVKRDTDKQIDQREDLISEIFKNPNPLNTSVTEKMTPVSKLTSNETTFRSGYNNNNNRAPLKNIHNVDNNQSIDSTTATLTGDTEPDRVEVYRVEDDSEDDQSDETAVNEEDSSTTDDDTEIHIPLANEQSSKKQERKGILSKMFKLFTPRNRRQPKKSTKEENDSESVSDDYQTIYSQNIARPKREVRNVQEVRKVYQPLPTKVIHSKHQRMKQRSPERIRRTPYMEQEYRRYWDEKLLFQERYANHSTEASRMTTPQVMPRQVYYQNYDARSALVQPNRHITASAMQNINRNSARKSSYVTNRTMGNRPTTASKGLTWLKKHKLGMQCGEQWKKLILEG